MTPDEKFMELFQGNHIAVGTEEGGCLRGWEGLAHAAAGRSAARWWERQINLHLEGGRPCGVYPVSEGQVRWGCIDWDQGEGDLVHAINCQKVLSKLNVTSWIERSRSKGFHLWVFCSDWVPQATMRKALLAVCQIAGAPSKEVNPKSFELRPGELGNYVRLPYPGREGSPPGRRVVVLDDEAWWHFHAFMDAAYNTRATPEDIENVAGYYTEPVIVRPEYTWVPGTSGEKLKGLARVMWRDGPLDYSDRSAVLYRFACHMVEQARHSPEEMEELVMEFDRKWFDPPKYADRRDGPQRVSELVEGALSGSRAES